MSLEQTLPSLKSIRDLEKNAHFKCIDRKRLHKSLILQPYPDSVNFTKNYGR